MQTQFNEHQTYDPEAVKLNDIVKGLALVCPPDGSGWVGEVRKNAVPRRPNLQTVNVG